MRVAIYARVSTTGNGQSPEMQLHELREYSARRGWTVAGEYVDAGISGAKEKRPELDRLMADAHSRRFDVVLVYRYDRFARSLRQLVNPLEEFRALDIQLIRERVRSGIAAARANGKRIGRPRAAVRPERIAALRAERLSWRAIAKKLGVPVSTQRDHCAENLPTIQPSID